MDTPNTTAPSPQEVEAARKYTREVAETVCQGNKLNDPVADNGYTVEDALLHQFPFRPTPQQAPVGLREDIESAIGAICRAKDSFQEYGKLDEAIAILEKWEKRLEAQPPAHSPVNTALPAGSAEALLKQAVLAHLEARAAYFDRTTGSYSRKDAARSYRATANDIECWGSFHDATLTQPVNTGPRAPKFTFNCTDAHIEAEPKDQQTAYLDGLPALRIQLDHPRWSEIQGFVANARTASAPRGGAASDRPWLKIDSAPKTGLLIEVAEIHGGDYHLRDEKAYWGLAAPDNPRFTKKVWKTGPKTSISWKPTHWRPLEGYERAALSANGEGGKRG